MDQVSRPVQIVLVLVLGFAGLWFVALRPKSDDGGGAPAPAPTPAAQTPAAKPDAAAPTKKSPIVRRRWRECPKCIGSLFSFALQYDSSSLGVNRAVDGFRWSAEP